MSALDDLRTTGDFLTVEETKRFVSEIIDASEGGLLETELMDACRAIDELIIGAAMVELWRAGRTTFSWHHGELHMRKEAADPTATP